jgi:hypothetical protein
MKSFMNLDPTFIIQGFNNREPFLYQIVESWMEWYIVIQNMRVHYIYRYNTIKNGI